MKKLFMLALVLVLLITGYNTLIKPSKETGTAIESIDLKDNINEGEVELHFGVGELHFIGSSSDFMVGSYHSGSDDLLPNIKYSEKKDKATLTIKPQKSGFSFGRGNFKNKWELAFTKEVPLSFLLKLGVGENHLRFDELTIKDLVVETGVGETIIDLSKVKNHNFNVKISSGVGRTKLIFSKDNAVNVTVNKGIGSVSASGFSVDGNIYKTTNDLNEAIYVTVDQGIGEVVLETR